MKFGVHTGPQNCNYDDLRRAWRMADENGFEWVSVWDHFYPALTDPAGTCFEAVSIMTALACETLRVRVGCLVFCAAYRNPAVFANAAVTTGSKSTARPERNGSSSRCAGRSIGRATDSSSIVCCPRFGEPTSTS